MDLLESIRNRLGSPGSSRRRFGIEEWTELGSRAPRWIVERSRCKTVKMGDGLLEVAPPFWSAAYEAREGLLAFGEVGAAVFVDAEPHLLEPLDGGGLALAIVSPGELTPDSLARLREDAERFQDQDFRFLVEERAADARNLAAVEDFVERRWRAGDGRPMVRYPTPAEESPARVVSLTTLVVDRADLPARFLAMDWAPALIDVNAGGLAMIAPYSLWAEWLSERWRELAGEG
jgi:hypothetical protein